MGLLRFRRRSAWSSQAGAALMAVLLTLPAGGCLRRGLGKPEPLKHNPKGWSDRQTREARMLFMVIETFRGQDAKSVYRRLRDQGRQMPDGLKFVNSWVAADLGRCFQLMEADDVTLFQRWVAEWADLMAFG